MTTISIDGCKVLAKAGSDISRLKGEGILHIKKIILFLLLSSTLFGASGEVYTPLQVCKAALSSVMGVDHKRIHSEKRSDGIVYMYYRIEGESDRYDYKCRLEGSRVIWGSAKGRWRTKNGDAVVTFAINSGKVTIKERFNDEPKSQGNKTTFPLAQL